MTVLVIILIIAVAYLWYSVRLLAVALKSTVDALVSQKKVIEFLRKDYERRQADS